MGQVEFRCQPSVVARIWVLLLHLLFTAYFIALPLDAVWRLLLVAICIVLCVLEYRKHATNIEAVLKYTAAGDWLCGVPAVNALQIEVGWTLVNVKATLRTPWLIAVDIAELPEQNKRCLLIWRDSLCRADWQLLKVCLSY